MEKIVRVGVTFPPKLLKEFDEIIGKMGYQNRSKAIQDSVRLFVSEKKWVQEEDCEKTGVLLMVYEHEVRGLESELTGIQHHKASLISSSLHIHIGKNDCLEAIAVRGNSSEIRKLRDELTAKRGVKILKTMIVSV